MAEAMSKIDALNTEIDAARTAGKLIEGAGPAAAAETRNSLHLDSAAAAAADDGSSASAHRLGPDSFKRLGMLGKGAVGKCYLVREKGSNQLYAMKVMGKADIVRRKKSRRIMLEREVMTLSRHPLVVALHASFQSTDFLHHVMEYCPGGPLYGVLRRQPYCRFDEATSRFYVAVRPGFETMLMLLFALLVF